MSSIEILTIIAIGLGFLIVRRAYPTYYVLNVFEDDDHKKIYCKGDRELWEKASIYEDKEGVKTNAQVIGKKGYLSGKKKH